MYLHLTPYPLDFMVQLLHGPVLPQQKRKQKMIEERSRLKIIRLSGIAALGVVMIGLGGCKHRHSLPVQSEADYDSASPPPPPMAVVVPASMGRSFLRKAGQGSIAYDHSISLTVPTGKVGDHLAHLRDYCLATAGCELASASEDTDDSDRGATRRYARLSARLPHDKVEAFLAVAAAPLAGEVASKVVTRQFRTNERDLHNDIVDVDRRLAQMTAYRDRLEALETQSAGKTDDLIKVAKELSEAQSALEGAAKEKKDLSRQVDTEEVNVTYESAVETLGPLRRSWKESGALFSETIADVWAFLIQAVVWAPLVVLGMLVVRRAIRRGWFSRG